MFVSKKIINRPLQNIAEQHILNFDSANIICKPTSTLEIDFPKAFHIYKLIMLLIVTLLFLFPRFLEDFHKFPLFINFHMLFAYLLSYFSVFLLAVSFAVMLLVIKVMVSVPFSTIYPSKILLFLHRDCKLPATKTAFKL